MARQRTEFQRTIDGEITTKFNNDADTQKMLATLVSAFMKTIRTSRALENNVRFFVKGGTSTKLLSRTYDPDWSDWDTQLIINPNLPIWEWYALFDQLVGSLKAQLIKTQLKWEQEYKTAFDSLKIEIKSKAGATQDPPIMVTYNLTLAEQNQIISTYYTRSVHPAQVFDNVHTIYQRVPADLVGAHIERDTPFTPVTQNHRTINRSDLKQDQWNEFIRNHWLAYISDDLALLTVSENSDLKLGGDRLFDGMSNDEALALIDGKAQKLQKLKKSSSLINTTIKDFYLFRVIVKYELKGYKEDGKRTNDNNDVVSFRGELLDISIPRHDSEESINQWTTVNTLPVKFNDESILVPDWEYQLKENITLITEVLEETTSSAHKLKKRITRGKDALSTLAKHLLTEKHNSTWQAVLEGLRIRQELIARGYDKEIQSIKDYSNNQNDINLLLLWILYSIEKDYNLSYYFRLFEPAKKDFEGTFKSLQANIKDEPKGSKLDLSPPERQFLNIISFSKTLFAEYTKGEKTKREIEWRFLSDLIQTINAKPGTACMGSVASSLLTIKRQRKDSVYPYVEIISSKNLQTIKGILGPKQVQDIDDQRLMIANGQKSPVLISTGIAFRPDETETRNGYLMLRPTTLIARLNEKIATANSYYLLHALDELKREYQKAITTF